MGIELVNINQLEHTVNAPLQILGQFGGSVVSPPANVAWEAWV